jgi:hypothetical protein
VAAAIDRALALLKWPIALVALVLLPGSATALGATAHAVIDRYAPLFPLLYGFVGYGALWWFVLRRPAWGSLLSTLEHEVTHAIFALLTFHRVVGMTTSWRSGGHTAYTGGTGNWLISVAPYFFPTASVAAAFALAFVPSDFAREVMAVLGATLAYHVTSTWAETHHRQTDLHQAGFFFSLAFLPTANLLCFGAVLAFAAGGTNGALRHFEEVETATRVFLALVTK